MFKKVAKIAGILLFMGILTVPAQAGVFDIMGKDTGSMLLAQSENQTVDADSTVRDNTLKNNTLNRGRGQKLRLRDGSCLTNNGTGQRLRDGSGRNNGGRGLGRGQGIRDGSGRNNGGRGLGLVNGVCPRLQTPPPTVQGSPNN